MRAFFFLIIFSPFDTVVYKFCQAAGNPAYRISEANKKRCIVDIPGYYKKVYLPDNNKAANHYEHWPFGIAASSQGTGKCVIHAVCNQEKDICVNEESPKVYNGLIF